MSDQTLSGPLLPILFISTFITSILMFGCSNGLPEGIVIKSIGTIAEHGVYFGLKTAKIEDDKAKVIEEGIRVSRQLIENNKVEDFINVDDALATMPAIVKGYASKAITIVNAKYADAKGKIPPDKISYIKAILDGSFAGVENYRKTLGPSTLADYETLLKTRYNEALDTIDN